jgi:hypothetical protein
MTNEKEPGTGGEEELQENQSQFIRQNQALMLGFKRHLSFNIDEFLNVWEEADRHHDRPHPKRELRIRAWIDAKASGACHHDVWLHKINYNMKKAEWLQPGKIPRGVADLGTLASLAGFYSMELLKAAMAGVVRVSKILTVNFVIKADVNIIAKAFADIITPPTPIYAAVFSDDCVITIYGKRYNLDISKCDSSQRAVFGFFGGMVPDGYHAATRTLIKQCEHGHRVYSATTPKIKIKFKPTGVSGKPTEYSGFAGTTPINKAGFLLILAAIEQLLPTNVAEIHRAARHAGYLLKVDHCKKFCQLQFLKHSPVYDTEGVLRAVLNPGVLLRASGDAKGDVPGHGLLETRFREFQYALVYGMYPHAHFTLRDRMLASTRVKAARATIQQRLDRRLTYTTSGVTDTYTVTDANLYERYNLTTFQINQLNNVMGFAEYEDHLNYEVLSIILKEDYGLVCTDRPTDIDFTHHWNPDYT